MSYQSTRGSVLYLVVFGAFMLALAVPLGLLIIGIGVTIHCRHHGKQAQDEAAKRRLIRERMQAQQESRQASAVRSLTRGL